MSEQTWWYLARAAGIAAVVLLVASLVLGVLFATRALRSIDRPAWLLAMHRWLSTLTIVATALHLVGLVADSYVHFGWKEIVVPGTSRWRPLAVTLGVVSLYLLIAIHATSLLMKRIPKRWWRAIHVSSYAAAWFGVVHAALAGTDVGNRAYQITAMVLTMAAVTAAVLRVVLGRNRPAANDRSASRAVTRRPTADEKVTAGV
jgi:DMSO/TMAO reductase YedYZ heme-binding membrane subunit